MRRLDDQAARDLARCIAGGGVVLFPADTVYGLACDPANPDAVQRLYELKGRPPAQPAAVMFFALDPALDALPELGARTRDALPGLLPGPVTLLLPNPRDRWPLACRPMAVASHAGEPSVLGLRVPALTEPLAALATVGLPVLQSSANISGMGEARTLDEVDVALRSGVDLALDGGQLPGVASTVLDLRDYEQSGRWRVVRDGPLGAEELRGLLG